jgi:hypothetical protein
MGVQMRDRMMGDAKMRRRHAPLEPVARRGDFSRTPVSSRFRAAVPEQQGLQEFPRIMHKRRLQKSR